MRLLTSALSTSALAFSLSSCATDGAGVGVSVVIPLPVNPAAAQINMALHDYKISNGQLAH
jgi:hypothetical protein